MPLRIKQTDLSSDPVEVFRRLLPAHDHCFLLETLADADQPQTNGLSYIGVAPRRRFAAHKNQFFVDGKPKRVVNPFAELRRQPLVIAKPGQTKEPAPYIGGLVGYMSHEAMRYVEPSLKLPYRRNFFDFQFDEYRDGLVFEHGKSPAYFYYDEDRSGLYSHAKPVPESSLSIHFVDEAKNSVDYKVMVERARDDIINGRVFQAVLANKYEYRYRGELLELYKELRRINPSPFMFFLKFGDIITLGASPELLSHTAPNGRTYLEALAGTIGRGKTAAEDKTLAERLLHDEKEIAEHNMLVDLVRNDVGRVSEIGSVRIDKLKYLKKLSHVQHICSLVSGQLAGGYDAFDALAAAFPAGTLVGAPKLEAAKMITELEGYERGPYGGTVGYFSYNGDSMHAVNIRSLQAAGDRLFVHSGSGIVYDSRPGKEYAEVARKKAAMDVAMAPFMKGSA